MGFIVAWLQRSRWKIRTKLFSGFAVLSLFLLIITILSIITIGELGNKVNAVSQSKEEVTRATIMAEVANDLENSLTFLKEDMITLDLINQGIVSRQIKPEEIEARSRPYLLDLQRQRYQLDNYLKRLNTLSTNFDNMSQLNSARFIQMMQSEFSTLLSNIDQIRGDTVNTRYQTAIEGWSNAGTKLNQAVQEITDFKKQANQAVETVITTSRQTVDEANSSRYNSQFGIAVTGGLALILALIFGLALTRSFTQPLSQLRRGMLELAGGNLTNRVSLSNHDEYGELAQTFNQSLNRLNEVIGQFQGQALRVSSAATQIAAASRQAALISADQAGSVAETTVTIEELSHTAQQIAEAAGLVAHAAEQALSSASDGQEAVRTSITGINGLKAQVQDIALKILALSERSQRVGHIIEQITGIADQTHLLALNASIESAAAGENGKRFAVVAAEVKKLSERSRNATKEVQAVLSQIQGATNASVMATEQGMKEAERGVALAHRSGDANESIIQMVERTVQLANAISLATQQQRSASEQVVASMRQLATVIQEGAASARQSSSLAIILEEIAEELRGLSRQFQVEQSFLPGSKENFGADGGPSFENSEAELTATAPLYFSSGGAGDGGTVSGPLF